MLVRLQMNVNETSSMELLHWIGSTHPIVMEGLAREKVCHCGICIVCAYYKVQGELRVLGEFQKAPWKFIRPDREGPEDVFYGVDSKEPCDPGGNYRGI